MKLDFGDEQTLPINFWIEAPNEAQTFPPLSYVYVTQRQSDATLRHSRERERELDIVFL